MTTPHSSTPVQAPDLESALAAIRDGGLRVSAARRMVLEVLFAAQEPLAAEEIVRRLGGRSDPASVYRNLEALERIGLVRHFHLGHGAGLYARIGLGEREYLICDVCGSLRTVEPTELDGVRELIRRDFGHQARFTHFPIAGLCKSCAAGD
ncbi:MAG: transcriptional repressor [Actinomycetota bacterium]|nr:transcriptional repressor [Actinomycetota bacterium]